VAGTEVETGARQQALSEFFSLIEGRDLLLTHADKQIRQLRRKLTEKQVSCARILRSFSYNQSVRRLF